MEKLIDKLSAAVSAAFAAAGYDPACGKVTVSNRPDLCEFQCNGAMPAAKSAHKAPILIANDVVAQLGGCEFFASAEAVAPGFINLRVAPGALADYHAQRAVFARGQREGGVAARVVLLPPELDRDCRVLAHQLKFARGTFGEQGGKFRSALRVRDHTGRL